LQFSANQPILNSGQGQLILRRKVTKGFRDRFGIVNADFLQMNLYRPPFADASMDVIISNGVLHHTADPEGGFRASGYIPVGLYNWLGRLPTFVATTVDRGVWGSRFPRISGQSQPYYYRCGP
jgi:Methyltransferase domain